MINNIHRRFEDYLEIIEGEAVVLIFANGRCFMDEIEEMRTKINSTFEK